MIREQAEYTKLAVLSLLSATFISVVANNMIMGYQIANKFQDKVARSFENRNISDVTGTDISGPALYRLLLENGENNKSYTIYNYDNLTLANSNSDGAIKREVNLNGDIKTVYLTKDETGKEVKSFENISDILKSSSSIFRIEKDTEGNVTIRKKIPKSVDPNLIRVLSTDNTPLGIAINDYKKGKYQITPLGNNQNIYENGSDPTNPSYGNPGSSGNTMISSGSLIGNVYVERYKESTKFTTETKIPQGYLTFKNSSGDILLTMRNVNENKASLLTMTSPGNISDGSKFSNGQVVMPSKSGLVNLNNNVTMTYTLKNPGDGSNSVSSNDITQYINKIAKLEKELNDLTNQRDSMEGNDLVEQLRAELDRLKKNPIGTVENSIIKIY